MKTECNLKQPSFHPITMPACVARSTSASANDKGFPAPPPFFAFVCLITKVEVGDEVTLYKRSKYSRLCGLVREGSFEYWGSV